MESDVQPDDHQWSLESLNKVYQQGYMAGLTGQPNGGHGHSAAVLAAAWEAGWDDGREQHLLHKQKIA
ncbi:ribosome modulation factor [Pseudomonas borbori]